MEKVYLDYTSCAPVNKNIIYKLSDLAELYYNASSINAFSTYNKYVIESVRRDVANFIGADQEEIYFVSSASEGNSLAVDGFLKVNKDYHAECSQLEHSSIFDNPNVDKVIGCDRNGYLKLDDFKNKTNTLFAVTPVNNEIGIIQNLADISDEVHKNNNILLCDYTAGIGHIPINVKELNIDMLTFSAQKIGGIKGVGVLYVRKGIDFGSIIYGSQENGKRGGTYNELAIKCLGLALKDVDFSEEVELKSKTTRLIKRLLTINGLHINGTVQNRVAGNVNFRIKDLKINSHELVRILDDFGYIVSNGSGCNSNNPEPSHVLLGIGLNKEEATHSIRVTFDNSIKVSEIDSFVECLKSIVAMNT